MSIQAEHEVAGAPRAPASPRQVTIIANDIGPVGGMERVLTELIVGLSRLAYRITVVARTCQLPPEVNYTFRRVRGPGRPALLAYPWFLLAAAVALRKTDRDGARHATGAIVLNRVDVITVHYCHQVGPVNPSRSTLPFRLHSKLVGFMSRRIEQVCFRLNRSATFVCVSEGVASEVREHYPALADRVLTIHNGVDTRRFTPGRYAEQAHAARAELTLAENRSVALFVGSEWERKGLEPVIRALALAPEWQLVVAGSGDRARYERIAQSLGVADAVRWAGLRDDVEVLYELADVLVFPTSYEAFPLVALEAAASGVPLLVTPVSGVRELVRDGEAGFLITREPGVIANRLKQL